MYPLRRRIVWSKISASTPTSSLEWIFTVRSLFCESPSSPRSMLLAREVSLERGTDTACLTYRDISMIPTKIRPAPAAQASLTVRLIWLETSSMEMLQQIRPLTVPSDSMDGT